jgi:hypothetical protein
VARGDVQLRAAAAATPVAAAAATPVAAAAAPAILTGMPTPARLAPLALERPFFLTLGGLWFAVLLVLGHVLAAGIVVRVRRRAWNDFAAVMIMGACVVVAGVAGILLDMWYFHSWGFGVFMGTVFCLASDLGRGKPSVAEPVNGGPAGGGPADGGAGDDRIPSLVGLGPRARRTAPLPHRPKASPASGAGFAHRLPRRHVALDLGGVLLQMACVDL